MSLVLLRHGESVFNAQERFTGWTDADLTQQGEKQARQAGRLLRDGGHHFDLVLTSWLRRAIRTAWLALEEMDRMWLPVETHWRLNERHFGDFEGLTRPEIVSRFGDAPLRRIHDRPPVMAVDDPRHPSQDARYRKVPLAAAPAGEGFEDLVARVRPLFEQTLAPALRDRQRVLVVAHGVTVRALDRLLFNGNAVTPIPVPIPTATPLLYHLEPGKATAVHREWLANPESRHAVRGSLPAGAG